MRDVPDRLVLDLPALPIRAAQKVADVLPILPLTPIGDNVNRARRPWSARHERTIQPSSDRTETLITDYARQPQKDRNPSNHPDPASQPPVIEGNFGLDPTIAPGERSRITSMR